MNNYVVKYDGNQWVVDSVGVPRMDRYNTKKEALKQAKYYAKKYGNAKIEVYKKNGGFQKELNYQ